MPQLTITGRGSFAVPAGTRLVNAIRDAGVDIGHRCGGWAGCTTCRVEFVDGEPGRMTRAEKDKLAKNPLGDGVRLACQLEVDGDMEVKPVFLASAQDWPDAGPEPDPAITPPAEWLDR